MASSGLLITACEKVKQPIFSEAQVIGTGKFSHITGPLGSKISEGFERMGCITSSVDYSAFIDYNGKVTECNGNKDSKAHEDFHALIKTEGIRFKDFTGLASTYFSIFDESAATAVNEYALLDGKNEEIEKSVNLKRQFGRDTYDFMLKVLDLEEISEQEVNDFASRSFARHSSKNWASMFVDLKYFGLVDPCYRVLEKYGLEQGQKELITLAKILRDDATAESFLEKLQAESGIKLQKIKPITMDIVKKGWIKYQSDEDNLLSILFYGPRGYEPTEFRKIKQAAIAEYLGELDTLGELWMRVWAKEIITAD